MEKLTYSQALQELQQLMQELEDEQLDLDEMGAKAARAAQLIAYCREKLRGTEEQIDELFKA